MPWDQVMKKWKQGVLKSGGSGRKVTNRKQAIAITMSEKGRAPSNPEYRASGRKIPLSNMKSGYGR